MPDRPPRDRGGFTPDGPPRDRGGYTQDRPRGGGFRGRDEDGGMSIRHERFRDGGAGLARR